MKRFFGFKTKSPLIQGWRANPPDDTEIPIPIPISQQDFVPVNQPQSRLSSNPLWPPPSLNPPKEIGYQTPGAHAHARGSPSPWSPDVPSSPSLYPISQLYTSPQNNGHNAESSRPIPNQQLALGIGRTLESLGGDIIPHFKAPPSGDGQPTVKIPVRGPSEYEGRHEREQSKNNDEEAENPNWVGRSDVVAGGLMKMIVYLTTTASEDWGLILDVCDRASASDTNAKEAVKTLKREFRYGEPPHQLSTARLWAIMLRNCSTVFVNQSTDRSFLDSVEALLLNTRTSPVVRDRVLGVVAAAAYAAGRLSGDYEGFRKLWMRVKPSDKPDEGVPFALDDPMFAPPVPPRTPHYEEIPSIPQEPQPPGTEPTARSHQGRNIPTSGIIPKVAPSARKDDLPISQRSRSLEAGRYRAEMHALSVASTSVVNPEPRTENRAKVQNSSSVNEMGPPLQSYRDVPGLLNVSPTEDGAIQGAQSASQQNTPHSSDGTLPISPSTLQAQASEEDIAHLLQTRILSSKDCYRTLLEAKDSEAQRILDILQNLLNAPRLVNGKARQSILAALLRLSASSGLYPQQLKLNNIEKDSSPVTAGQFGEIWKGRYQSRPICLKIFKLYQKTKVDHLLKNFSREAIVWSQLSHPNLLPFYGIYHLNDSRGRVGLVAPWMQNGNLTEYLEVHPNSKRLPLVHDILAGLRYLHQHQVVHGDLKGVNILINSDGSACLTDFGLSSIMDADTLRWTSLATITQVGGTVRWMAPENIEAADDSGLVRPTFASDIYSLASVLFETYTGQVPYYEYPKNITVLSKILSGIKPKKPESDKAPELSVRAWKVMEDCWSTDPDDRPTLDHVIESVSVDGLYRSQAPPATVELRGMMNDIPIKSDMVFLMTLLNLD